MSRTGLTEYSYLSCRTRRPAVEQVMEERAKIRDITLAEVRLDDGQRLLAFNDFLLGDPESHFRAVADHMWPRI